MTDTPWLLKASGPTDGHRLYVFPYAGGNPAAFLSWSRSLAAAARLAVINLPGRGSRYHEPHATDLRQLAMQIAGAISADAPARFSLFGHSMGAVLALEVARIFRLMHMRMPEKLIVSGCRWPGAIDPDRGLHLLDDAAFHARLRAFGGTPDEVLANAELLDMVTPALRADFAMLDAYAYRPSLALPVALHVFAGRADAEVPAECLENWRLETNQPAEVHWFGGGHFFIHSDEKAVLQTLGGVLA